MDNSVWKSKLLELLYVILLAALGSKPGREPGPWNIYGAVCKGEAYAVALTRFRVNSRD